MPVKRGWEPDCVFPLENRPSFVIPLPFLGWPQHDAVDGSRVTQARGSADHHARPAERHGDAILLGEPRGPRKCSRLVVGRELQGELEVSKFATGALAELPIGVLVRDMVDS